MTPIPADPDPIQLLIIFYSYGNIYKKLGREKETRRRKRRETKQTKKTKKNKKQNKTKQNKTKSAYLRKQCVGCINLVLDFFLALSVHSSHLLVLLLLCLVY